MMMRLALPLAALILLLPGCSEPPRRTDPFAGISSGEASPFRALSITLVASENTKAAVAYLHERKPGAPGNIDGEAAFREVTDVFQSLFGSVAKASSLGEAASTRTDLVAVVDLYAVKGITMTLDAKVIVMTPDGARLEEFEGRGRQSQLAYPSFSVQRYFDDAARKAAEDLRKSLLQSRALPPLAQAKAAGAPAPSVAAAGPALPAPVAPNFRGDARPDDLAVIVGIESYSDIAAKAPFAERDAEAFKSYVSALGVPERNIVLLKGPKAGKASIEKYVETWLPGLAKADGRVYFYFSGHGAPDVKTGKAYLVPWDGDPNFLEDTAIPLERLYARLGALPSKHVLVAMDSCFSGAGGRSVLASGARPLVTKVDAALAPSKVTVLSASAGSEIAGSLDDKGHGAFTYFLLQGLNAGRATPKALLDYLTPQVQDEARRLNRAQTPQLQGDADWPLR